MDATKKFKARYYQAVTAVHFLANLINPILRGKNLRPVDKEAAKNYLTLVSLLIKFEAR